MRNHTTAAVLAATGAMLASGSLALAAGSAPTGGTIRVFVHDTSETKGDITVTGAIGDYGTTISEDANGKPDPNGNFQKVILKHGTFVVNGTALNKTLQHARFDFNKTNCSGSGGGTGPTTVGMGTGAYAGISGKLTITVTYAAIAPRKGSVCNTADNAPSFGEFGTATGSGTISFTH